MLPLRICLILAILAGIGVIVVSQAVLKPQFEGIIQVRNDNKTGWDKAEGEKRKLASTLKATEADLKSTKNDLDSTKDQLKDTAAQLAEQKKLAAERAAMIAKLNTQLKAAEDELAAWKATGFTVDQIAGLAKQVKDFKLQNEGLGEENKLFKGRIDKLEREIASLKGPVDDPAVPDTARGRVLVVDPKWDFLVLDVGSKLGLIERGVLLISRNGVLVAKVRVTNVQQDRSIANIMPGWKLKDVMEGDQVFPYAPTSSL